MLVSGPLICRGRHCFGLRLLRCAMAVAAAAALFMVLYFAYHLGQAHVM